MSLHVRVYTPAHRPEHWPRWHAWFYRPDEHSTGGTGFKTPISHVCFMWGER